MATLNRIWWPFWFRIWWLFWFGFNGYFAPEYAFGPMLTNVHFGALKGRQASKGIFLTTSSYQDSAKEYAKSVSDTLILLDGNKIAEFMIEAEVGVSSKRKIVIPVIDNDYSEE